MVHGPPALHEDHEEEREPIRDFKVKGMGIFCVRYEESGPKWLSVGISMERMFFLSSSILALKTLHMIYICDGKDGHQCYNYPECLVERREKRNRYPFPLSGSLHMQIILSSH